MNYYNPYMGIYPYISTTAKTSLFSSLFKNGTFSFSSIINGTQKTLGIINQAIPVIKQVSPVVKNAKTMFKVMNEFKKTDTTKSEDKKSNAVATKSTQNTNTINNINEIQSSNDNGLTFFI